MKPVPKAKKQVEVKKKKKTPRIILEKDLKKSGCDECGILLQSHHLKQHTREVHLKRKDFSCTFCAMKFGRRWTLGVHLRIHKGELPHSCNICDLKFRTTGALTVHNKERHETQEQPKKLFQCPYCPFSTRDKGYLEVEHKRTHSGEKPYKCPVCDFRFSRRFTLKTHCEKQHGYSKQNMMDAGMYSQQTVLKNSKLVS